MKNKTNKGGKPALRCYFFDTEFNDQIGRFEIDLISLAIVDEDGNEYYGISKEFNVAAANEHKWLKKNVMDKLDDPSKWVKIDTIRKNVLNMIKPAKEIELWARNGSYDNVLLCQLFGGMGQLFDALKKRGVEKVTFRDFYELQRDVPNVKLWHKDKRGHHVALNDARQERLGFELYTKAKELQDAMPAPHMPHVK